VVAIGVRGQLNLAALEEAFLQGAPAGKSA